MIINNYKSFVVILFSIFLLTNTKADYLIFFLCFYFSLFMTLFLKGDFLNKNHLKVIFVILFFFLFSSYTTNIFTSSYYLNRYFYLGIEDTKFIFLCTGIIFFILIFKFKYDFFFKIYRKFLYKIFITAYCLFWAWICILRPFEIVSINFSYEFAHDKFNFFRLATIFPIFIACLVIFPFLLKKLNINELIISNFVFIYLCFAVIFSMHSEPIIWWSRRYLTPVFFFSFFILILFAKYFNSYSNQFKKIIFIFFIISLTSYLVFFNYRINYGQEVSFKHLIYNLKAKNCKNIYFDKFNKQLYGIGNMVKYTIVNKNIFLNQNINKNVIDKLLKKKNLLCDLGK